MSRAAPIAAHRAWPQVLLTAGVFLMLAARVPLYWRSGEFIAEDGWVFFADAWNRPWWESLVLPYAGYFHLLPRLLAELCSTIPIVAQPYAYAILGLGLNAVILSAFYLPVFRRLIESDAVRLGVVLLLALAPNAQNLGLLLGLHWYLAVGLVLILLAPVPTRPGAKMGACLFILLGVWSSPSALALFPVAAVLGWKQRTPAERLKFGVLLGALLVVAALVLMSRVTHPERTGEFSWGDVLVSLDRLVLRGWLGTGLLGPRVAGILATGFPSGLDLFALAVIAAVAGVLWKNRGRAFVQPVLAVLASGLLMLLLSLGRTAYVAELATLALPLHTRYLTAPTLLLYLGLGMLGFHVVSRAALAGGAALVAALLLFSLPGQNHWSRPAVWFHLRDAVPAIARLRGESGPASLYIPADVPYWGPVLEKNGGIVVPPEAGLAQAVHARPEPGGQLGSWLGRFTPGADGAWIEHEAWGELRFTGVERGRVFFRDRAGRLLFTSPLLYPGLWRLDGAQWTLVGAPPPG